MQLAAALAALSPLELLSVAGMALLASAVGGVAGYGTGVLMPLVLVPIVGAEPIVPIIAISALMTNTSRAAAFRRLIDWRRTLIVLAAAAPTSALGAWGYTLLTSVGASIVIGGMLMLSVPLRRLLKRREVHASDGGLAAASVGYGLVVGGTVGSGIILLSLLMAAGLEGGAVIATDATISIVIGLIKIAVFGVAGVMSAQVVAFALLIGVIAFPGAFLAKAMVERMPIHLHTALLDAVVLFGGAFVIIRALFW
ncbi:MAG TPA: sulfite exporter TauE/SafE family protein [Xanthobacteraceae bacterium]|nr:sulfite exporter TauE/SafE family protein [Xanthobacteraceae bacterium]